MPVTVSAAKALRRDQHRTQVNRRYRARIKMALDQHRHQPTEASLQAAYQILDRAAKVNIIHQNKAARLKSQLAKQRASLKAAPPKKVSQSTKKPAKKTKRATAKA